MTNRADGRKGRVVVVVGPTAVGKSALAVRLAQGLNAEVVSADSMQVYRHFDIGTGKLSLEERQGVVHHLIDVADPHRRFSAAEFVRVADRAIDDVWSRGRAVVVVGGTGLYVRALLRGLFPAPNHEPEIRARHASIARRHGPAALHAELRRIDPESARTININDVIRISRALEIFQQTGQTASALRRAHGFGESRYHAVILGLRLRGETLRARIERRIDQMMAAGWLAEVSALLAAGYGATHPMGALGYVQLSAHLRGEMALEDAVDQTKRRTWRFSRRQCNWFRHEPHVRWVDAAASVPIDEIRQVLDGQIDSSIEGTTER